MITPISVASALIRVFEGCRLTSYKDAAGIWTIGFGHTANVAPGVTITLEQAEAFLTLDIAPVLELVKDRPALEAGALISFGYNCGIGALRRVLAGTSQLTDFDKAKGQQLPGLTARRGLEAILIEISRGGT